jgi:outer membrane protein
MAAVTLQAGASPVRRSPAAARKIVLALALACAAGASQAQALPGPAAAPPRPVDLGQALTLDEYIQQVVLRNASAQAARLQAEAAGRLVQAERALYDPTLVGRARRELSDRPRTFEEQTSGLTNVGKDSAIEQLGTASAGLRGKLPSGATFEFGHEMRRRASNLLANADVRENRGTLTLTIKQPLLRGYGRASTEADLRVAEKEQQVEAQRFVKQLQELVADAAGLYWQLYRAERTLQMRERSVAVARDLQAEVQRRIDGGFAPRVERFDAELTLSAREAERVRARQLLLEAQARARNLLTLDAQSAPTWTLETAVPQPAEPSAALSGSQATAPDGLLERAPGYRIAQLRLEQEQIRYEHARRQERPDVSLELGLNRNSLTDSSRSGLEQSFGGRHPGHYAGIALEMPLDNGAARARREGQGLRRDAARLQLDAEARTAHNEWSVREGQWRASIDELGLLRRELQAREALLAAEQDNYRAGRSRLRQLVEAQDRLDESRLRQLDAVVRARVAEISLRAAAGEVFSFFGLRLVE